jgi:hypothetical protein
MRWRARKLPEAPSDDAAWRLRSRVCGEFEPRQHLCITAAKEDEGAAAANPVLPAPRNDGVCVVVDGGVDVHALVLGDEDDLPWSNASDLLQKVASAGRKQQLRSWRVWHHSGLGDGGNGGDGGRMRSAWWRVGLKDGWGIWARWGRNRRLEVADASGIWGGERRIWNLLRYFNFY